MNDTISQQRDGTLSHLELSAVPLFVYRCPGCEIELEELRPARRADEPEE